MNTSVKERPGASEHTASTTPAVDAKRSGLHHQAGPTPDSGRKSGWIAVAIAALVALAAVTVVWFGGDDGPATAPISAQQPAFDSPGGNSLNVPVVVAPSGAPTGNDSPGGNSLDTGPGAPVAPIDRPAFDSPGGNSLHVPAPAPDGAPSGFDSPGGNSLNNS